MNRLSSVRAATTGAVFAALCAGALGVQPTPTSQPGTGTGAGAGGTGGERERGRANQQPPSDGKALREFLERRMEEHRQGLKRFEEAMKKIEEGGDPAAIARELFEGARDNRRATPGSRGDEQSPSAQPGQRQGNGGGSNAMRGMEFGLFGGPRLSPEDRANARKALEEKHPELLRKLNSLAAGNAETGDRYVDGVHNRLRWLETMREKEPEEYALRMDELTNGLDVIKLGREVNELKKQSAPDAAVSNARTRLREAMSTQFDTRQKLAKLLLTQLRARADKQEQEIKKNDQDREGQIDRRMEEFLRMFEGKGKKGEKPEPEKPAKP